MAAKKPPLPREYIFTLPHDDEEALRLFTVELPDSAIMLYLAGLEEGVQQGVKRAAEILELYRSDQRTRERFTYLQTFLTAAKKQPSNPKAGKRLQP